MGFPRGNRIFDRVAQLGLTEIFRNARLEMLQRSETTTSESRSMYSVDFPVTALLAIVGTFPDGTTAEITTIGSEGFVEIDSALRHDIALRTSMCLVEGSVIRLPIGDFQRAVVEESAFADLIYHAVRVRSFMTEQLALCGIHHTTEQRFARWLLLATHKLDTNVITITQESVSGLLGTRRASISIAATAIQKAGAIRYVRGRIEILNRDALKALSCPCYDECKNALEMVL
jgi:hypothetical protein